MLSYVFVPTSLSSRRHRASFINTWKASCNATPCCAGCNVESLSRSRIPHPFPVSDAPSHDPPLFDIMTRLPSLLRRTNTSRTARWGKRSLTSSEGLKRTVTCLVGQSMSAVYFSKRYVDGSPSVTAHEQKHMEAQMCRVHQKTLPIANSERLFSTIFADRCLQERLTHSADDPQGSVVLI